MHLSLMGKGSVENSRKASTPVTLLVNVKKGSKSPLLYDMQPGNNLSWNEWQ